MELTISTRKSNGTLTVIMEGAMNRITASDAETQIQDAMKGIKKIVFDMEKLSFISSAGLRVLVKLRKQVGERENMEIRSVQPDVMNIFSVTGLADYLNIRPAK